MTELKLRTNSVNVLNAAANAAGKILKQHPNEKLKVAEIFLLVQVAYPKSFTAGQIRKGLAWQTENNSQYIKTWVRSYHYEDGKIYKNTRFYWYESNPVVQG